MNEIDKIRKEYRGKVGSTHGMTWEWYAEWLEIQLIESRAEVVNENDLLPRVSGSFCVEAFHVGFKYEELEMDKNRYLNQGEVWVKKTYNLNSPRLHKIDKLIKSGKIRALAK